MNKVAICVKGISGSGKSTRVYLFLKFLREIVELEEQPFYFKDLKGKDRQIGILFPKISLLFIGKEYQSGDFTRFQGLDVMTGVFGSNAGISEFVKSISDKYSVIIEGAGTTQSHRFRPQFLHDYCGYNSVFMQYYNYGGEVNHEEYYNRIIYRSGKKPTRDTMWDKEQSYTKEVSFSINEKNNLGDDCEVAVFHNLYNESPNDFGVKMCKLFFPKTDYYAVFIEFCEANNYIQENRYENFKK